MAKWKTSPLAAVCTVFGDGDWIESKDQSQEGVRLVQTGNVGEGEFKDRAEKARFISQDTFTRLRCTEIFAGDCLISRLPDPVGRACLLPERGERMITAVDCTIVRFHQSKLLPEFFAYYSQSGDYLAAVEREATGTTRKRISRARLGQIPVPLAPIPEQRRIVAILDEAFEGIATAKGNAEKNLQNAGGVFESELNAIFAKKGEGWLETTLGEIGKVCMCKRIFKEETIPSGGIPFFKIGTFGKEPDAFIPIQTYEEYRAKYPFPKKGSLPSMNSRILYSTKLLPAPSRPSPPTSKSPRSHERSRNPRRAHRPRAEGRRLGRGRRQPGPARAR
jgi:type I restriction enzyme S subunit